ncbi:MAG: inositol 2-dehydrogenase [Firmicutes bacterium]|jgi:myo-inositol 2-dehydrogenase/D-chiro-inositol 1-dehydrogenase|nr:inositol 2-dehydrogenase [Bacillota bacterium]
MTEIIRVGVIGAGRMGKIRVDNFSRIPGVEVAALATPYEAETYEWARASGIPKITEDANEILQDDSIQAVAICSPTSTHSEYVIEAAKQGKHIFCEKPIANTVAETKQVLEVVTEAGIMFQVGFNRRYDSNFLKIKELCTNGELGDIHIVNISSRDPARPRIEFVKTSGGMFVDMMIHDFDMIRYLTGASIEEVYAYGDALIDPRIGELGDVDTCIAIVKLSNGGIGTIDNSRETHYGYDQRVEVFGSKGSAYAKNKTSHTVEISTKDGVEKDRPLYYLVERYLDSFRVETEAFIKALREGTSPMVTGDDALQALLGSVAATISFKEKRPVRISELV